MDSVTHLIDTQWQDHAMQQCALALQKDNDVLAIARFGAGANKLAPRDEWSDLDLLLVVSDEAFARFHPALDWLEPFGTRFAYDQSADEFSAVSRVCFTDLRRIDFVITTESNLARVDEWPFVAFWAGTDILFARTALVRTLLAQQIKPPHFVPPTREQFQAMANQFWIVTYVTI